MIICLSRYFWFGRILRIANVWVWFWLEEILKVFKSKSWYWNLFSDAKNFLWGGGCKVFGELGMGLEGSWIWGINGWLEWIKEIWMRLFGNCFKRGDSWCR